MTIFDIENFTYLSEIFGQMVERFSTVFNNVIKSVFQKGSVNILFHQQCRVLISLTFKRPKRAIFLNNKKLKMDYNSHFYL